jgi:hypothetical protein
VIGLHEIYDDLAVVVGQDARSEFDNLSEGGWIAHCPDTYTLSAMYPEVLCSREGACQWLPLLRQVLTVKALAVERAVLCGS